MPPGTTNDPLPETPSALSVSSSHVSMQSPGVPAVNGLSAALRYGSGPTKVAAADTGTRSTATSATAAKPTRRAIDIEGPSSIVPSAARPAAELSLERVRVGLDAVGVLG